MLQYRRDINIQSGVNFITKESREGKGREQKRIE
jgi:hypothetical protein